MMINTGFRPRYRHHYKGAQGTPQKRGHLFNLATDDQAYYIEMMVPGFDKSQIQIEVKEGHLIISNREIEEANNNLNYHRRTFKKRDFSKSFILPEDVKEDGISAKVENGILNIRLQKEVKEEKDTSRTIAIS